MTAPIDESKMKQKKLVSDTLKRPVQSLKKVYLKKKEKKYFIKKKILTKIEKKNALFNHWERLIILDCHWRLRLKEKKTPSEILNLQSNKPFSMIEDRKLGWKQRFTELQRTRACHLTIALCWTHRVTTILRVAGKGGGPSALVRDQREFLSVFFLTKM